MRNIKSFFPAGLILLLLIFGLNSNAKAFCGFYVAKAGAKLYNKSSQVIIARDGNRTVITMSNDFQGDVRDFAMVVPVPVILKEEDIHVVRPEIFDRFDEYSSPRLVEYYDVAPCPQPVVKHQFHSLPSSTVKTSVGVMEYDMVKAPTDYQVTIEAKYNVGEYEILILSAQESDGLERWLTDNGYKIPDGAREVLEPYVNSKMKFFVVKVNLEAQRESGFSNLRPLQISFNSGKFMLPIRLGMANATDWQDLTIYAFSRTGRIETTNYHTVKVPTDKDIPTFMNPHFPNFYKDMFLKIWKNYGRDDVFLEYSWDLSGYQPVKCDPCVGAPPVVGDLKDAGIFWLDYNSNGYTGDVFITRLHARYSRDKWPQDLVFQNTPNKQKFQGRYVMRHPAEGPFDCAKGQQYLRNLRQRRQSELAMLNNLSGWDVTPHRAYPNEYDQYLKKSSAEETKNIMPWGLPNLPGGPIGTILLILGLGILSIFAGRRILSKIRTT